MSISEEVVDWFDHLRVRPNANGMYPHPGMWLTRGDWSESRVVSTIMNVDSSAIAPIMCRLGKHRWITVGTPWHTRCWYCETPLNEDS